MILPLHQPTLSSSLHHRAAVSSRISLKQSHPTHSRFQTFLVCCDVLSPSVNLQHTLRSGVVVVTAVLTEMDIV